MTKRSTMSSVAVVLALLVFGWAAAAAAASTTLFTATPHLSDGATVAPAAGQCTSTNPCTLRQAVLDANASTTTITDIELIQGTYALDPLQGPIDADPGSTTTLNILGNSPATTIINGESGNGVIQIGVGDTAGPVKISDVEITGGAATGSGGGIFVNPGATLTLTNSLVDGNSAVEAGGGIDTEGQLTVTGSTISDNSVTGGIAAGGGIAAASTDGSNSTPTAPVSIENSTITGNSLPSSCGVGCTPLGGGIYNESDDDLTLANVTVAGNVVSNSGVDGGGIANGSTTADLSLYNTVIADNGPGGDCGVTNANDTLSAASDFGGNIVSDASCSLTSLHSEASTNPELSVAGLAGNGGPTPTIALQGASPAITAGYIDCPATDQRGAYRPGSAASTCSSGAVEFYGRFTISGSVGAGSGTVSASDTGTNYVTSSCSGATCTVDQGDDVELTATPAAGYRFSGWVSPTCSASANTCTFNLVSGNGSVTANFTRRFTVAGTVTAAGGGSVTAADASGSSDCSAGSSCAVDPGDTVTLTATPSDPALVQRWVSGPCASTPTVNPCTVPNVEADQTDTVSFTLEAPGDGSNAVYVAPPPLGDVHNPGTQSQPAASVQQAAGIIASSNGTKTQIRVATGTYAGGVALTSAAGDAVSGIGIYGGFDPSTWQQSDNPAATTIAGTGDGVLLDGVTNITFQDLTISATVGASTGASVYGIRAIGQSSFTLEDVAVNVGNAAAGADGTPGANGAPGGAGGDGTDGATPVDVAARGFAATSGQPGAPGLGANGNLSGMLVSEYVCYPAPGVCNYPVGTLTLGPSGGDGGWGGTGINASFSHGCQILDGVGICGIEGTLSCTYGVDAGCGPSGQEQGVTQPYAGQPGSPSLDYTSARADDYVAAGGAGGQPGPYAANDLGEIAKPGAAGTAGSQGAAGNDGTNETIGGATYATSYTAGAATDAGQGEAGTGGGGGGGGSGQDNGAVNGGGDGGGGGGGGGGPGTGGTGGQGGGGAFGVYLDGGSTAKIEFGSRITVGNGGNGGSGGAGGKGGAGGRGGSGDAYQAGWIGAGGNGGSGGSGGGGGGGGAGIGGPSIGIAVVDPVFSSAAQSSDTVITTGRSGSGGVSPAAGGSVQAPSATTQTCTGGCTVVASLPIKLPVYAVVTGSVATLTVACQTNCSGTVLITIPLTTHHRRAVNATAISASARELVIGHTTFKLAARHKTAVRVRLDTSGLKQLRGAKRLTGDLKLTVKLAGGHTKTYHQKLVLTIKAPPKGKQKLPKKPPSEPKST